MFYFHTPSYVTFRTHVNTSYILCSGRATYLFVHRSLSLSLFFFSTSSHLSLFLHCDATRNGSITASMTQGWKVFCSGVSESRKKKRVTMICQVFHWNMPRLVKGKNLERYVIDELDKYTCMQRGKVSKLFVCLGTFGLS